MVSCNVEAETMLMNPVYSVILKFIDPSQAYAGVLSMVGFLTSHSPFGKYWFTKICRFSNVDIFHETI